jgi:hypothetical protein
MFFNLLFGGLYGAVDEQHSHIGIPLFQVGEDRVGCKFWWYANWSGSRMSGMMELMCSDQLFKALNNYRCECYRVIAAGRHKVLGNRDDGSQLETCGNSRHGQGEVYQLVCTCPEDMPWNTIWPCDLTSVDQF